MDLKKSKIRRRNYNLAGKEIDLTKPPNPRLVRPVYPKPR